MDIIIYHNNCPDGWCAAYIAKLRYPEAQLLPLNHGLNKAQLEDLWRRVAGKDVIMLDYSLRTRELNDSLALAAKSFRIFDHHKTAQAVLDGADYATFDMKRSGAGLAWDYLFGKNNKSFSEWFDVKTGEKNWWLPRPWWVNYTEDQDLWNWVLPNSQEINAYLMVQPRDVETWDKITRSYTAEDARRGGIGVRSYIEYYTRSVVAEAQEGKLYLDGRELRVAVVNIPYAGVSEAGNALVKTGNYDVALLWFERAAGDIQFSLRSNRDGSDIDVSVIAKEHGGGGHRNAAGFQVSLQKGRALIDKILRRQDNFQNELGGKFS